jgi:5-methylcytosine-specific restriction endonuclease McrA
MKCQGIAKRKHGKQNQGRRSPEDLQWKADVLSRDGYTCQHCGSNRKLEAHHIKEIQDYPELRHELSNGLTLCHQCHYYGVHKGMPNFIHGRYSKRLPQNPSPQVPI